jgi:hypothetical protein
MNALTENEMRRESVLFAVQRAIFCAVKKTVLDINNAFLITNRDNGQMCIVGGEAWEQIRKGLPANFADTLEVWEGRTGLELK